ncbi:M48 family metallopeptidase [bacterium]|nr:M48 family metallopeptidase [bacterium]
MKKLTPIILSLLLLAIAGCATVAKMGTQVAQGTGAITEEQGESLNRATDALALTFEDITPEQEYYIGRAVAATILQDHPPLDDSRANAYLNRIGQTVAMVSDRPETFGGYHFLLLDSDEINAFAAPGGLILVSRGLVACCRDEDALAAVLAHEIGHVQNKDGLRAIKKSRLTGALTTLAVEAGRSLGSEDIKELTEQFAGGIDDITQTLVNSGYARSLEHQADASAVTVLDRIGYDPHALVGMLEEMDRRWDPKGHGFERTHPSPKDRLGKVRGTVPAGAAGAAPAKRAARFADAVGGL